MGKIVLFTPTHCTSDISTDTSDTLCATLRALAMTHFRYGLQKTPQEGLYHHSLVEEQQMLDGHPSRY